MGNNGAIKLISIAHSQAHLQFAQANARPKIAKELVRFQSLFCRPEKKDLVSANIENEVVI